MNRYITRYNNIIEHYRNFFTDGVYEKHHIIPKCMGGSDEKENIVKLPPKAHFICHYLLHKAYPDNKSLAHAFAMMCVNNHVQHRKPSGKLYEIAKLARKNALKNVPRSETTKQKMRKPKYSNKNYFGNKNAKGNKGNKLPPRTEEHKENLRASLAKHNTKRKEKQLAKIEKYRALYVTSGLSRKEFAELHNVSYGSMKKYLRGI